MTAEAGSSALTMPRRDPGLPVGSPSISNRRALARAYSSIVPWKLRCSGLRLVKMARSNSQPRTRSSASACELTSRMAVSTRSATISASTSCTLSASGVVWSRVFGRTWSPILTSTVVSQPVRWPAWSRMAASSRVVEVLPSVPVTPTSRRCRDGWPRSAAARSARAGRVAGTTSMARSGGKSMGASATMPRAPRSSAWGMKARASCRSPGITTNSSPGCTRRESCTTPRTSVAGSPCTRVAPGTS